MDSVALSEHDTTRAAGRSVQGRVIRGLLYQEWLARGRLIMVCMAIWVIGVWVLPTFTHPAWYMAWGLLVLATVGNQLARADVFEGTEEFAFALPATRLTRYLVRFGLGLGLLLIPTCVGLLATRFNVPQALWGLVVESGFTEPGSAAGVEWYARALIYPTAAFALLFGLTALCQSRTQFSTTTTIGVIMLIVLINVLDGWLRPRTIWWVPFAILAVVAVATVVTSALLYMRKEGVSRPVRQGYDRHWVVVLVIAAVLLVLLVIGVRLLAPHTARPKPEPGNNTHEMIDQQND